MELTIYCENVYTEQWAVLEKDPILKLTITEPSMEELLDEIGVDKVMSHFSLKPNNTMEDLI